MEVWSSARYKITSRFTERVNFPVRVVEKDPEPGDVSSPLWGQSPLETMHSMVITYFLSSFLINFIFPSSNFIVLLLRHNM